MNDHAAGVSSPPCPCPSQAPLPVPQRRCRDLVDPIPPPPPGTAVLEQAPSKPPAPEEQLSPKKVPATAPGKCIVCLEDCDEVLGAGWLHQQWLSAGQADERKAPSCAVSSCVACLKTYFEVMRC